MSTLNRILYGIDPKAILLNTWRNQVPQIRLTVLMSFAVGVGGILAVCVVSLLKGVHPALLTRDPAELTKSPCYLGMLSYFGLMGWSATAAVCFGAAYLLGKELRFRKPMLFMAMSGVISMILLFDDAFTLHETVFPRLHVPEKAVFLSYLAIIGGYGLYFFRHILDTEFLLLALAFFFLGLSAGMDNVLAFSNNEAFAEDSPKFVGIVFWLAYFSRTACMAVKDRFAERIGAPAENRVSERTAVQPILT